MMLKLILLVLFAHYVRLEDEIDIHDLSYYYGRGNNTPVVYDAFFGTPITPRRKNFMDQNSLTNNLTSNCVIPVRPCQEKEDRRVDGTCTNPKYPSRGAANNPFLRLLPPAFGNLAGYDLVPAKDGNELPSARIIRTTALPDGFESDLHLTTLASTVFVFTYTDVIDLIYLLRYLPLSTCCLGNQPNRVNPQCIPIPVPADDPYQRNTGIRCLNLTTVETFQDDGCLPRTLPPERINHVTPLLDLSVIYGNDEVRARSIRAMEGGLLTFVTSGNRTTPPTTARICINNRPNLGEVECYDFGDVFNANTLMPVFQTALWFFREHNRIATELQKRNPCWDDEKLYQTARKINIAQWQYIFFYELTPTFLGKKYLLEDHVIYDTDDYVNDFNLKFEPLNYHEYLVGNRYFHLAQEARAFLYNQKGEYLGTRTVVDDSFRSAIMEKNGTEAALTQGWIRQPLARGDTIIDPDIAERYAGSILAVADLTATDIMRGRNQGLHGYNYYREYCGYKRAKKFEDLADFIDMEKVDELSRIYDHVDDVDFMIGLYLERPLPGSYIGPVLYCLNVKNLLQWRYSDRFFFEHGDYPTALTLPQLNSIRKTSIARILCDSGDQVFEIQPHAFERTHESNKMVKCSEIPGIDLDHWKDEKCMPKKEKPEATTEVPYYDHNLY